MAFTIPTIDDFKTQFVRDFPYGTDPETSVLDADITSAFAFTKVNFSEAFWADQAGFTLGYLLLTAHYLVMNLRASSQGINGQFSFLQQSKNAGAVAEASAIPQRVLDNPYWSMLLKTNYGAAYMQLVLPQLCGQIFSVRGTTRP